MTDWELGNDIMYGIVDKLNSISKECKDTRPVISNLLKDLAFDFGPLVNRLMNDDDNHSGMCPLAPASDEVGEGEYYTYFDGTSKRIYDKYKRIF